MSTFNINEARMRFMSKEAWPRRALVLGAQDQLQEENGTRTNPRNQRGQANL